MEIADTDTTGKLNMDEQIRWSGCADEPSGRKMRARFFGGSTRAGMATSQRANMLDAIRDYYLNDDPHSAGSWLLGPLEMARRALSEPLRALMSI